MLYEIGIKYDSDTVKSAQVFIPKVPISINRRKFWYGGRSIPHWNETTDPWVKVPVLQKGTTKIYLDGSANKDSSNIDATMIFGDDFNGTSLDTTKWQTVGTLDTLSVSNNLSMAEALTKDNQAGIITTNYRPSANTVIESKGKLTNVLSTDSYYSTQLCWIALTSTQDTVHNANYSHLLYTDLTPVEIYHQSRNNSNWVGSEVIYSTFTYPTYYIGRCVLRESSQDWYICDEKRNVLGNLLNDSNAPQNFAGTYYLSLEVRSGTVVFDYIFVHKYLPASPQILYIKPYHSWWLFAQQGGVIKEFFAGVFESITHSKEDEASANEQITHETQSQANSEEIITQARTSEASSVENITQAVESVSSTLESISQDITTTVSSLEQIIKEYDFKASSLEQISNTKDSAASTLEEITQTRETVVSTVEQMINEFDFYASSLESIRNQVESVASAQESISNQVSSVASVNEQIAYVYEYLGSSVEQIQKSAQSLAGTLEEITQNKVSFASTLEEIEHIVAAAKPFLTKALRLVGELKTNIKLIDELKATIKRM